MMWPKERPAYTCPTCDLTYWLGWAAPCNEDGTVLYCREHAPRRTYTVEYNGRTFHNWEPEHYWCRRGEHVMSTSRCKVSHAKRAATFPEHACERCGTTFTGRSDAKFCSPRCRTAAHREAARI
jgi:formylmethanofuran dehydrogenase subunit E